MAAKARKAEELLVDKTAYLSAGVHIGMKQQLKAMKRFIFKVRPDKLAVFDVNLIDRQLRTAAKMLAGYKPEDVLVVSRKRNGHKPVAKFAEAIGGARAVYDRFYPGTLTNPSYRGYIEPKIVVVTDPNVDKQAVQEAFDSNIPIIGLCDTFNDPQYIDFVISVNNKGRKSIPLVYYLLAREVLRARGDIKGDAEFRYTLEDFEMPEELKRQAKADKK